MEDHIQTEIDQNYKHNFLVNVLDGTFFWFGASFFATRTIAPLFLSYLTDSTFAFGILSTVVSMGYLIPQLFTANFVQNLSVKKVVPVKWGFFTERLPILLLPLSAFAAFYSYPLAVVLFLLFISWHILGAGVVSVGWQDMLAKVFSVERRGRFFGTANFGGTATGVIGASVAGWLLGTVTFPYNFMYTFGVGALFILISWFFLAMTREPAVPPEKERESHANYWRSLPRIIKADANFRRYIFSQIILAFGTMALGYYTLYTIRQWDVDTVMVGFFTTSLLVGQAVSNLVFGWLSDKWGHKLVLQLSIISLILSTAFALFAPSPGYFYVVFFLQGVYMAGTMLSGIMIVFEFCEPGIRPTYIGLTNSITGLFAGIAPMVGGVLIEGAGFGWLFIAAFVMNIVGLYMLHYRVREPRVQPTLVA